GGEPYAVGRDDRKHSFPDQAAVRARVVDRAAIHLASVHLAQVGKPEAALAVENNIVRPFQRHAVAFAVQLFDLAARQIDALDASARIILGTARGPHVAVGLMHPGESAVVAKIAFAVRPDCRTIRAATGLRNDVDAALLINTG